MALLRRLYGRLRLEVNEEKSAVGKADERKFLGYSFWFRPDGSVKLRVADKTKALFKSELRSMTKRVRGQSLESVIKGLRPKLIGWKNYFRLSDQVGFFRDMDKWIRHRLRALRLKQWKRGRTIFRELRKMGATIPVAARVAGSSRRWWHNSAMDLNRVLDIRFFDRLGLPKLAD